MSASEVFERMFNSNTIEAKTNCISIEDITPKTMNQFINYLYTNKLEDLSTTVEDLYAVSDKYGVQSLKRECIINMSTNCDLTNIFPRLKLAYGRNDPALKQIVLDFAAVEAKAIITSMEWGKLLNEEEFVGEIADEILKRI
jgi:hypothetical protein